MKHARFTFPTEERAEISAMLLKMLDETNFPVSAAHMIVDVAFKAGEDAANQILDKCEALIPDAYSVNGVQFIGIAVPLAQVALDTLLQASISATHASGIVPAGFFDFQGNPVG